MILVKYNFIVVLLVLLLTILMSKYILVNTNKEMFDSL